MRATELSAWLVVCLLGGATPASAAPPRIINGTVTTRAVAGALAADVASMAASARDVLWIGYAVPANAAGGQACCHAGRWGEGRGWEGCGLDGERTVTRDGTAVSRTASLEASGEVAVFIRVASGAVGRVAAYAADCEIDAGGRAVTWLTGVTPAESIAWLADRAAASETVDRGREGAMMAVAFHADASADRVLERLALAAGSEKVQRTAVFWMGAARAHVGFEGLKRVLAQASSDKVRQHVTFAMSISKEPGAVEVLLDTARQDRSSRVRSQALFWLAQKAGARVAAAISDVVVTDPDTEVKKRAVFALSQLPADESVTRLIDVARSNKNREVRKQAMFWLGQSKDPRALEFFGEILGRR